MPFVRSLRLDLQQQQQQQQPCLTMVATDYDAYYELVFGQILLLLSIANCNGVSTFSKYLHLAKKKSGNGKCIVLVEDDEGDGKGEGGRRRTKHCYKEILFKILT